jgi:hypothetical protein
MLWGQLADTRGRQSAKYTLVHYLVDVLKQHDPLALGVVNEMNNVPKAAEGIMLSYLFMLGE